MKDIAELKSAKDKREYAQDQIMQGIANALGYWTDSLTGEERHALGIDGIIELNVIMQAQANRLAKIFGYEEAWVN